MKNPLKYNKWLCLSTNNKMIAHTISDILVDIVKSEKKEGIVHIDSQGNEKIIEIFVHIEEEGDKNEL